jgi:hypothetical protein
MKNWEYKRMLDEDMRETGVHVWEQGDYSFRFKEGVFLWKGKPLALEPGWISHLYRRLATGKPGCATGSCGAFLEEVLPKRKRMSRKANNGNHAPGLCLGWTKRERERFETVRKEGRRRDGEGE